MDFGDISATSFHGGRLAGFFSEIKLSCDQNVFIKPLMTGQILQFHLISQSFTGTPGLFENQLLQNTWGYSRTFISPDLQYRLKRITTWYYNFVLNKTAAFKSNVYFRFNI